MYKKRHIDGIAGWSRIDDKTRVLAAVLLLQSLKVSKSPPFEIKLRNWLLIWFYLFSATKLYEIRREIFPAFIWT